MDRAVIIDVVRTATGARNGRLSGWHPVDLAAEVLGALVARTGIDPGCVDDVILGCVTQAGAQSVNVARNAVLAAGFPETVPATTVDRQCGSSQQALHFAAQGVAAGAYDVVIAGGVEVMSLVPLGASLGHGFGKPFGPRAVQRYDAQGGLVPQGLAAELVAEHCGLSRDELDGYAVRSHQRALAAIAQNRFATEIVGVAELRRDAESGISSRGDDLVTTDEAAHETSLETLGSLRPAFKPGGMVTAGNSAPISDGASAALIMSEARAERLGLRPRARVHTCAVVGVDPISMLTGPVPATQKALARAGLGIGDIDCAEVNEAFAAVVLAWERALHPDMDRVNVNGGAIALGHPLGASGTKLLATLLGELERSGGRYGLLTMCEGGGMANATIIERLG